MDGQLKSGTSIQSRKGKKYTVKKLLGSGGQGEVYEVFDGSQKYAMKWYFKSSATPQQEKILKNLIEHGKPSESFLWPEDFVKNHQSFGYIMGLRPKEYSSIEDLMAGRVDPSFENVLLACYNLTHGFQVLHSQGYQYRDISRSNVFFNANNGNILICDNDNVVPNGEEKGGVLGTQSFMAPEIVRGEAEPSRLTDLYSLSVLLFQLMFIAHPLDGELEAKIVALDYKALNKLYGTHPVFIFDPNDDSNRPVKGIHGNAIAYAKVYPAYLKRKFTTAFTDGLHDPERRVTEREWKKTLSTMVSSILYCPDCGAENFYDPDKEKTGDTLICWSCKNKIKVPSQLVIDSRRIPIISNKKIFSNYINDDGDMTTIVAEFVQNPKNPNLWGLRNKSQRNWTYFKKDGTPLTVEPNKVASIMQGVSFDFGNSIGKFE